MRAASLRLRPWFLRAERSSLRRTGGLLLFLVATFSQVATASGQTSEPTRAQFVAQASHACGGPTKLIRGDLKRAQAAFDRGDLRAGARGLSSAMKRWGKLLHSLARLPRPTGDDALALYNWLTDSRNAVFFFQRAIRAIRHGKPFTAQLQVHYAAREIKMAKNDVAGWGLHCPAS